MSRVALCAMVKNEARDIAEWLAYHTLLGFDAVMVFDNGSSDGTDAIIEQAGKRLAVQVRHWPRRDPKCQTSAYEQACRELAGEYDWVAFFDADEFLVLHQDRDIKSLLAGFDECAAVGVNWAIFGTNGHEDFHSGLVIDGFTRRSADGFAANQHIKSIVRPERVIGCQNPHFFHVMGAYCDPAGAPMEWLRVIHGEELQGGVSARAADFTRCQLNHYHTRSRAQWLEKLRRGYPDGIPRRRPEDFDLYNRNEVEDRSACSRSEAVREVVAELGPAPSLQPVVHVIPQGNMANRMIQHLVAVRIACLVPNCRISNVELPEWGYSYPALPETGGPDLWVQGQYVEIGQIAARLRRGALERVNLLAYGQRLANLPSREDCATIFPADPSFPGYGADRLVCNIRGSEVLDARHPDYTLLPPRFYAEVAERTGLVPVFMGQIEDNAYCEDLRRLFPEAEFRASEGGLADFQTFRNSRNLVPAVSTFSWLAAWLSDAQRIVLAVNGLFHPVQAPDVDLLPLADPRYSFVLFPINYSVPVGAYRAAHAALQGLWRQMRPEAIAALRAGPRWKRRLETAAAMLDETFYAETYADVAKAVAEGGLTAIEHYCQHGFAEGRRAFRFDRRWYSTAYPLAAFEVGQGDYADLEQHYVEIGRARGYRPTG